MCFIIKKIIKNQISIIFLQYNLKSRRALRENFFEISYFLIGFLNFQARTAEKFEKIYAFFLWDFLTKWPAQREIFRADA